MVGAGEGEELARSVDAQLIDLMAIPGRRRRDSPSDGRCAAMARSPKVDSKFVEPRLSASELCQPSGLDGELAEARPCALGALPVEWTRRRAGAKATHVT